MSYIGNPLKTATFLIDSFNGDGTTVDFTLREAPGTPAAILVFVGGVRQHTDTYSVSAKTLTFTEAPPSGTNNIQVLFLGLNASPSVPSDSSVTTQKIVDGAVTAAKLAAGAAQPSANAITTNELANDAVQANNILAGAVTGDKIGLTAINANNIVDATITSSKLASTISISELSTTRSNTIAVNANNFNLGVVSGNVTINVAQSTFFTANTSNDTTWIFEGEPDSSKATGFVLELTSGGDYTQTWPAEVKWPSGTAPTLTTGVTSVDVLVFITNDGGTIWRGAVSQANSA